MRSSTSFSRLLAYCSMRNRRLSSILVPPSLEGGHDMVHAPRWSRLQGFLPSPPTLLAAPAPPHPLRLMRPLSLGSPCPVMPSYLLKRRMKPLICPKSGRSAGSWAQHRSISKTMNLARASVSCTFALGQATPRPPELLQRATLPP